MRADQNPNKSRKPVPIFPDVSLAVVTHYTDQPYHHQRLPIVRMSLESMLAGAKGHTCELIVWDNGSPPEFRAMLHEYNPDMLVESVNIGVSDARHNLCHMARGKILSMADDDLLYAPDWLDQELLLLNTYPGVGVVAGSPQRSSFNGGHEPTFRFSERPDVRRWEGRMIPDEWEHDFAVSIGADKQYNHPGLDRLMEYKGVKAWCHGHHMQMLCFREVIEPFLTRSPYLLDKNSLNVMLGEAGLLQLSTYNRTVVHIGNVIDPTIERIQAEFQGPRKDPEIVLPKVPVPTVPKGKP
jgi:hypothetical protein